MAVLGNSNFSRFIYAKKSRKKRSVVMVRIMTVYVCSDLADDVGKYFCYIICIGVVLSS